MTKCEPDLSILMPVYKPNLKWLRHSLVSLSRQQYAKWKLVISLDGTDKYTDDICGLAYGLLSETNQVTIVKGEHVGIVGCLNRGLAYCDTPYTARMDVDDICLEERFLKQIAAFALDPELVACGTQIVAIDSEGRIDSRIHHYPESKFGTVLIGAYLNTPFAHPTLMFRTNAVKQIGGYADYRCMEDYDLGSRLSQIGAVKNLPTIELCYRLHEDQYSRKARPKRRDLLAARLRYAGILRDRYGFVFIVTMLLPWAWWLIGPNGEYRLRRGIGRILAIIRGRESIRDIDAHGVVLSGAQDRE